MRNSEVRNIFRKAISLGCVLLLLPAGALVAQNPVPPAPQPGPAAAPPPQPLLGPNELDNLVAPVALYPDSLLGQLLVASTYPLEVVEAAQWLQQNRNLQGQQLVDAARQQNWDASIQALVVFPDVLNRLNSDVRWTTDLGNAFLAQQADVMAAVQRMRARAQAAGRLNSTPQQTVTTQTQGDQTAIQIVPANPEVIYVPVYDPAYIWGPPVWGYYPPLFYSGIGFGFGFGPGIFIGSYFGGLGWGGWGWGCNWFGGAIFGRPFFFAHYGFGGFYGGGFRGGVWVHNPEHRLGVPYRNAAVASRFGGSSRGAGGFGSVSRGMDRGGAGFGARGNAGVAQRTTPGGATGSGGWNRFGQTGNGGQRNAPAANSFRGSGSYNYNYGGAQRSAPSYRSSPAYNGGSSNFRSAPNAGNFRSAPSFNGGGSSGFRSAPSFNGGGHAAAPSFRSSPSFGGGGGGGFRGGGGGGGGFHGGGGGGGGFHGGGGGGGSHGGGGGHGGGGRR